MTEKKRLMLTLDDETAAELDRLKQIQFYDKPYSDMYRYLIKVGLASLKAPKENL